jgi:hypothetical protein
LKLSRLVKLPPRTAFSIDSPGRSDEKRSVPGATMRTTLWGAAGRSTTTSRGRSGQGSARAGGGAAPGFHDASIASSSCCSFDSSKSPATISAALFGR